MQFLFPMIKNFLSVSNIQDTNSLKRLNGGFVMIKSDSSLKAFISSFLKSPSPFKYCHFELRLSLVSIKIFPCELKFCKQSFSNRSV